MTGSPTVNILETLTKDEIKQKLGFYLTQAEVGRVVREKPYHDLLLALLHEHPDATRKIGVGVRSFFVAPSERFPSSRCFNVRRIDDSTEEFSFNRCLNSPQQRIAAWARQAIDDQMRAARTFFSRTRDSAAVCALTGQRLKDLSEWDVDHAPSFSKLLQDYLCSQPPKQDGTRGKSCLDGWAAYHAIYAKVRPVCRSANNKQSNKIQHEKGAIPLKEILNEMGWEEMPCKQTN